MKAKKPKFRRQDSHKKKRINPSWKKPKGIQSKMRLSIRGYCSIVKNGYSSPKKVKGLSREGLIKVNVSSIRDLEAIDKEKQGIIISSKVGKKKTLSIINAAIEKQIMILNFKDAEAYAKNILDHMQKKKEEKTKKLKAKEKKKEEKKKEKLEKKVEKEVSEEEKKQKEKKEKDKLLISKKE